MRLKTRNIGISILVLFLLDLISCNLSFAKNNVPSTYNVLVMQSYHSTLTWSKSIEQGIETYFEHSGQGVNLQIEYMDSKRVWDETYKKVLYDIYKYKYKPNEFNLIISVDNNAFDFLLGWADSHMHICDLRCVPYHRKRRIRIQRIHHCRTDAVLGPCQPVHLPTLDLW